MRGPLPGAGRGGRPIGERSAARRLTRRAAPATVARLTRHSLANGRFLIKNLLTFYNRLITAY